MKAAVGTQSGNRAGGRTAGTGQRCGFGRQIQLPDPPPLTVAENDRAKALIARMKCAQPQKRAAMLEEVTDPAELAWVAILFTEDLQTRLLAVSRIQTNTAKDVLALHELCCRTKADEDDRMVRAAAIEKLAGLEYWDTETCAIIAMDAPDQARRQAAVTAIASCEDWGELRSCATYGGYEDTRRIALTELRKAAQWLDVSSVATFCKHGETADAAIDILAANRQIELLVSVGTSPEQRPSCPYALKQAVRITDPARILEIYQNWTRKPTYTRVPQVLATLKGDQTEKSCEIMAVVNLARTILEDKRWDKAHANDPDLRERRLAYALFRTDGKDDSYFAMSFGETTNQLVNEFLRKILNLTPEQTADLEVRGTS